MLYDECQDCCISFDSYIKPQLLMRFCPALVCCISFDSYIKPQHSNTKSGGFLVVYLLIPTSNHNSHGFSPSTVPLYIFWFLHQTTTICCIIVYIFLLYIFWFLHQTTTAFLHSSIILGCISFDSYIKPQQCIHSLWKFGVVYLLIPTSNHNLSLRTSNISELYIFWFLHQTTTCSSAENCSGTLYIFWFLHQTTTVDYVCSGTAGCISFDSYIKPQLEVFRTWNERVVYLLIPTSNHNLPLGSVNLMAVVYLLIPTSNHNQFKPTSHPILLYIFWFLHQTTTSVLRIVFLMSCISFDSYIKPQLHLSVHDIDGVVYLLIPTSNHNWNAFLFPASPLYIFWFLHQTTTNLLTVLVGRALYIFWFLHQTTTAKSRFWS